MEDIGSLPADGSHEDASSSWRCLQFKKILSIAAKTPMSAEPGIDMADSRGRSVVSPCASNYSKDHAKDIGNSAYGLEMGIADVT